MVVTEPHSNSGALKNSFCALLWLQYGAFSDGHQMTGSDLSSGRGTLAFREKNGLMGGERGRSCTCLLPPFLFTCLQETDGPSL